jgi:putative transposase
MRKDNVSNGRPSKGFSSSGESSFSKSAFQPGIRVEPFFRMGRYRRIINSEFPIHITGRTNNRESFPIPMDEMWGVMSDYLHLAKSGFGFLTHSFLLMPNHFHWMARDPQGEMSNCMQYLMRETSREIGRLAGKINRVWGAPFGSSIIGKPLHYLHAYKYIYRNPVKGRLCESVLQYPYSTLSALIGNQPTIIPLEEDELLFNDFSGTLEWLDHGYSQTEEESIRLALRRKEMKFPVDKKSRRENSLEDWKSIPSAMQHYKK